MLVVNWKQSAISDLEQIIDYIFERNPVVAIALEDEIVQTAERLVDMPYSGRQGRVSGTRERIFHPNYMIVYQITSASIDILSILHSKREYP